MRYANKFFPLQQILPDIIRIIWLHKLNILIILGVLIFIPFLSILNLSERRLTLLFILLLGVGFLIGLLNSPQIGIIFLTVASLIVPFSIGTGTQTSINVTIILLALLIMLWLVKMLVEKRKIQFYPSKTLLPSLLFSVMVIISFLFGQLSWFGVSSASLIAQIGGLMIFLLSIGAFLLSSNLISEVKWLHRLTFIFLLASLIHIIIRIIPSVGRLIYPIIPRGASGSLFWVWLVALGFSQAVLNKKLNIVIRTLLLILVTSVFYVNFFIGRAWISGWFPPLITIITILFIYKPRFSIIVFFIIGLVGLSQFGNIQEMIMVGDNTYSLITRIEAWKILIEIVKVNPVFGLGPANYYWYSALVPILGYYVPFNSHNNYIDLVAQNGLIGLICLVWLFFEIWRLGWKLRFIIPAGSFTQAYVYGVLGGLMGMLVAGFLGDWVIPFVYNLGFEGFRASVLGWIFLGGLVAVERLYFGKEKANPYVIDFKPG